MVHNGSSQGAQTMPPDSHEEFQELCALSTTGELTAEESAQLSEHIAQCDACRKVKLQYERLVATAIPVLAAETLGEEDEESAPSSWSIENAEKRLVESLGAGVASVRADWVASSKSSPWKYASKYSAAAMILAAVGLVGYQVGIFRQHGRNRAVQKPTLSASNRASQQGPSVNSSAPEPGNKGAPEEDQVTLLRRQVSQRERETAQLKGQLSQLEGDLQKRSADLEQSVQDRAELSKELEQAQANARTLQTKLTAIGNQTSEDTAELLGLKTKIEDLNASLEEKGRQIAREQELLEHDSDIRNVIGARNLYIAEIYDVAKNGDTEKPFGRVFYTKDKSLVFYGYDLDQQRGFNKDTTFQAWGRGGADNKHDVSLGLLYQEDAGKKCWVLKFNDPTTIAQLDAFFITAEPEGGSVRPTGMPLLFTYLRLNPNHP